MSSDYFVLLFPQAIVGFIDAVSLMIVLPSLIFYVKQAGGTKEQYGIVCSAFALASFTCKPILGYWSDKTGNKFRAPYLTSIAVAALGAFLYFFASLFSGQTAITLIFVGRLLGGCGAANNSLGYTYITQVVPPEEMTKASAILSMVRVLGMSIAPGLNALLYRINYHIRLGSSFAFSIDSLNVVGLVMCTGNVLGFLIMYHMLVEPPAFARARSLSFASKGSSSELENVGVTSPIFWKNVCQPSILVPILAYFTLNFNFQFMETGLAPAANDTLGWETVAISIVFGIDAVLLFFVYMMTFELSAFGMGDISLMKSGLWCSVLGYTLMYLWWRQGTVAWMFVLPIVICTAAFPFLGSPTRSIFSFTVAQNEVLCRHQGTMQAILSMTSSVAGFTAPTLFASFVLQTHDEAASRSDHRVLGSLALVAPALAVLTLCCLTCEQDHYDYSKKELSPCEADGCYPGISASTAEERRTLKSRDLTASPSSVEEISISSWTETHPAEEV